MRRDEVFRILSEHWAELEQAGVRSLACFGSVARDEAGEDSNIDILMAAFERGWDNEQDAVYDNWRESYGVPEG